MLNLKNIFQFDPHTCSSISMNPGVQNSFATCGEDGSVRLWADGDCVRDIRLPVQSVWSVTCLDNGDIVTGERLCILTFCWCKIYWKRKILYNNVHVLCGVTCLDIGNIQ